MCFTHVLQEVHAYPGVSILGLVIECGARARSKMLRHLLVLLSAERLATSHVALVSGLDCMCWTVWPHIRLLSLTTKMQGGGPQGPATTDISQGMRLKAPEGKVAEDTHQFVRDDARRQRFTKVEPLRVMRASLEAAFPRTRGLNVASVGAEETSRAARCRAHQKAVWRKLCDLPKDSPASLDGTMQGRPSRGWQWLLEFFLETFWRCTWVEVGAPWQSTLAPPRMLLHRRSKAWLVLASSAWGCLFGDFILNTHSVEARHEPPRQ